MVKIVSFFKRSPGVTVEEFQSHWRSRHAELVVRLPGLRRYVQNHTLLSGYEKREPDFDGIAEAWFDDTAALRVSGASAEYRAVKADEAHFLDSAGLGSMITEEVVIVDGVAPANGVKMISFLDKRSDLSPEAFQQHWRTQHAQLAAQVPGQRRYVQCHVYLGIYRSGRVPPHDGAPMSWFDDLEALRAAGASAELAATRADEPNFMASDGAATRLPFSVAREVEIEI
jgi:uncharacterized protein (TIGR02118 family)